MTTPHAEPVLLTEDEAVAIALIHGRAWPVPMRTVDGDDADLRRSGGRGARSLRLRDAISDDERMALAPDLVVVANAAAATPRALGAVVDETDRISPWSPLLVLLTDADSVYAVRVDPDGVLAVAEVSVQDGAEMLVGALTSTEAGGRFAVTLRDADGSPAGGLRRHDVALQRTDPQGMVGEPSTLDRRAAVQIVTDVLGG